MSEIPCTGKVGRSLVEDPIIEWLCNEWKEGGKTKEPRIVGIYGNKDELKVADIGCGGCADHYLLEETIEDTLKEYGVEDPEVEIIGVDVDEELVRAVKDGDFQYMDESEVAPEKFKGKIDSVLENYFECKDSKLKMKDEYAEDLNLVQGDIFDLPFQEEEFDMVISAYLMYHLEGRRDEALENLSNILKEDGPLLTETGFYRKKDGGLDRVGREEKPYRKIDGELHPVSGPKYDYFGDLYE